MKVIALIGDIKGSRNAQDRGALQQKLASTLEEVNRGNESLHSPYTITLGDEFQAVYKNARRLFQDMWIILTGVYPYKIRFSIGLGELTTPINPRQAIGMDGPAFHHARKGIQDLKKTPYFFKVIGDSVPCGDLINQGLNLLSSLCNGWEKNRFHILLGLINGQGSKYMAQDLGISTVAVYKNKKAGALDVIRDLGAEVASVLDEALGAT